MIMSAETKCFIIIRLLPWFLILRLLIFDHLSLVTSSHLETMTRTPGWLSWLETMAKGVFVVCF